VGDVGVVAIAATAIKITMQTPITSTTAAAIAVRGTATLAIVVASVPALIPNQETIATLLASASEMASRSNDGSGNGNSIHAGHGSNNTTIMTCLACT
jgi:hypothetical protein